MNLDENDAAYLRNVHQRRSEFSIRNDVAIFNAFST